MNTIKPVYNVLCERYLTKEKRIYFNSKASKIQNLEVLYNTFTGKGGLHFFKRSDFSTYYRYAEKKQEYENGQFFTPDLLAELIIEMLEIERESIVADICCGKGTFFNYLSWSFLYWIEKDLIVYKVAKKLFPFVNIQNSDIQQMKDIPLCDYIVWNPPFNIHFKNSNHIFNKNGVVLSQSYYLYKAEKYLKTGGILCFICPFFKNPKVITANTKVKKFIWDNFEVIAWINIPRWIFKKNGTNIQTKILILKKKKIKSKTINKGFFQTTFKNKQQVLKEWRESKQYLKFKQRE